MIQLTATLLLAASLVIPEPGGRDPVFRDPKRTEELTRFYKSQEKAWEDEHRTFRYVPPPASPREDTFNARQNAIAAWFRHNLYSIQLTRAWKLRRGDLPIIARRRASFANHAATFFPALFSMDVDARVEDEFSVLMQRRSGVDRPIEPRLKLRLEGPLAVVNALPGQRTDYLKVFRRAPTRADLTAMSEAARDVSSVGRGYGTDIEAALSGPSTIIAIVGHNEGGSLRLPDGRAIDLREIAQRCAGRMKVCLFVVCSGRERLQNPLASFEHPISPAFAAHVIRKMDRVVSSATTNGSAKDPLGTFSKITDTFGSSTIREYHVRIVEGIIVIVAVALVAACDDQCPDRNLNAPITN